MRKRESWRKAEKQERDGEEEESVCEERVCEGCFIASSEELKLSARRLRLTPRQGLSDENVTGEGLSRSVRGGKAGGGGGSPIFAAAEVNTVISELESLDQIMHGLEKKEIETATEFRKSEEEIQEKLKTYQTVLQRMGFRKGVS
jgi:hypothetical protein